MIAWLKKNKLDLLSLFLILAVGSFLRLYQIRDMATFLGDEGRDALIVKGMILDHQWTLLGPTASFGNLYLGPIYYYFMLLPLWLSGLDPVGPAVMVACFGIASIFMVWLLGKLFFGREAGLVASLLYAVSPLVIVHTRSSWNPNPMPFFSLLAFLGLFQALKRKDDRWLMLTGASLGVALQLHYIAFALIASIVLIYLLLRIKTQWKWILASIGAFLVTLSPQILFELRHNLVNSKAMVDFFLRRGEFKANAGIGFDKLAPVNLYFRLFSELLANNLALLGGLLGLGCFLLVLFIFFKKRAFKTENLGLLVLSLWMLLGILLIPLYRGKIHDHYLGFLFPAPFLFLGFALSYFGSKKTLGKLLAGLAVLGLVVFNLSKTNLFSGVGPNYQIQRTREVAKVIAEDVGSKKFNIALVSPTGDFMAMNYRYFLELYGKKAEPYGNFDNIDVLYVIEGAKWVTPNELGLWEVGTFGPNKPIRDWTFDFQVIVYRLEHQP